MLRGIDPILNADVLYALRAMGHGDDLIIADTNFPSDSIARETVLGDILRIDRSAAEVIRAVLSGLPNLTHLWMVLLPESKWSESLTRSYL